MSDSDVPIVAAPEFYLCRLVSSQRAEAMTIALNAMVREATREVQTHHSPHHAYWLDVMETLRWPAEEGVMVVMRFRVRMEERR